jgi:hypothetical protein
MMGLWEKHPIEVKLLLDMDGVWRDGIKIPTFLPYVCKGARDIYRVALQKYRKIDISSSANREI